jgi:glycosyltransferase involved in cell wall biosynthesis
MKLCFLADARSPIAQNWIHYFSALGHDVHVISSYPCDRDVLEVASLQVVPVAFSGLTRSAKRMIGVEHRGQYRLMPLWVKFRSGNLMSLLTGLRHWFGPIDVYRHLKLVRRIVEELSPDIVHAMRIPFEGILAAEALRSMRIPLLISVWGNDFTFHANHFPLVAYMTRRAMKRADALHPDCYRDLRLARAWGFDKGKPALVLPGSGGVQLDVFYPGSADLGIMKKWSISSTELIVFYPRRFRPGSVRTDTFFKAVPLVLKECPKVTFICVGIADHPVAEKWRQELQAPDSVCLLPSVSRAEMAHLFRLADVIVSPSEHDGTPNTLLEGMACGAFPVLGNIESVREWIEDGVNGLLCDPASPESLAQAILRALDDEDLRRQAAMHNQKLIAKRADYQKVMARAEEFYRKVTAHP